MNDSDEQIAERVLAGDKELFAMLVDRYQRPLYNLMARYSANPEDAADLTQEAFVRAFDKLGLFNTNQRFFPWLYRLAINLANDWSRKNARKNDRERLAALTADDTGQHPQQLMEDLEDARMAKVALMTLPEQTREILVLRYQHGCSIRETAAVFKLSESATKMRIKRGLAQLKTLMTREPGWDR